MKEIKGFICIFLLVLFGVTNVYAFSYKDLLESNTNTINTTTSTNANNITVEIDGKPVSFTDQQPIIKDSRTLVPIRGVFEQLGYTVGWNDKTKTATLSNTVNTVIIAQGGSSFTTNGRSYVLDVSAQIINGRMMLPFRAIVESVGYGVGWDADKYVVIITSNKTTQIQTAGTGTQKIAETYYTEFPTVLNFGTYVNISMDRVVKTTENSIVIYKYDRTVITAEHIRNYVDELVKLGFIYDEKSPSTNYLIYVKGDISISIDITTNQYVIIRLQRITTTTTVSYYIDYPQIPDIGGFVNPKIKFAKTTNESGGKGYWYKGITDATIQIYINELLKLGYVQETNHSKSGYYIFVKGGLSIVVDTITYKSEGYIIIIIKTVTTHFPGHPTVPTIPVVPVDEKPTDDGDGTVYWYIDVNEITIQDYIKVLISLGYTNDTGKSKTGYYVYVKGNITIIIDSISTKGYVLITIRQTIIVVNDPVHPEIPILPPTGQTTGWPTGKPIYNGTIYWYDDVDDITIQKYIKILINMGYAKDVNYSKAGYHVYAKGDWIVIIDTISIPEKVSITIIKSLEVYHEFYDRSIPPRPTGPKNRKTEDGRETSWYADVNAITIQEYIKMLIGLGYTKDNNNSEAGYYVYVNGDKVIIIDANSTTGYVLITFMKTLPNSTTGDNITDDDSADDSATGDNITDDDSADDSATGDNITDDDSADNNAAGDNITDDGSADNSAADEKYPHFPTIPTVGIAYNNFTPTNDELGYAYWYSVLEPSLIENYVGVLADLGFTITEESPYYICEKDDLTVFVDAVAVTIINTSNSQ